MSERSLIWVVDHNPALEKLMSESLTCLFCSLSVEELLQNVGGSKTEQQKDQKRHSADLQLEEGAPKASQEKHQGTSQASLSRDPPHISVVLPVNSLNSVSNDPGSETVSKLALNTKVSMNAEQETQPNVPLNGNAKQTVFVPSLLSHSSYKYIDQLMEDPYIGRHKDMDTRCLYVKANQYK